MIFKIKSSVIIINYYICTNAQFTRSKLPLLWLLLNYFLILPSLDVICKSVKSFQNFIILGFWKGKLIL